MVVSENSEFDIFVGSKIGSFKHIKYYTDKTRNNKKCIENLIDVKTLQKDEGITCMEWADTEQTDIMLGRKNGQIQLYNTQTDQFMKTYNVEFGSGDIIGVGRCKRTLMAGVASGVVRVWSKKTEVLVDTGGKLDRCKMCQDDATLFATGGEENDLKVYRLGEITPLFSAKNLAHDWLQLRRPVWVSDLAFLPGEGGNLLAACSRHGYVRLYDTRAQRRPVCNVDFEGKAATSIAPSFEERRVLVGFGRGQLHQVDLRAGRQDKGYKGAAGAITSAAAVVADTKFVVSASLDRHIRVHQFESKELVYKQYLTSKLACLLVQTKSRTPLRRDPKDEEVKEEVDVKVEEDEMDELFDEMETVCEKPSNKPSVSSEPNVVKAKRMKPSTEGSTDDKGDDAIMKLLKSTEKQKRKRELKKKEKKAKSVFHNA